MKEAVLVLGETGAVTRNFAIKTENTETRRWAPVDFSAVHCVKLTEDAALLTYTVSSRWNNENTVIAALTIGICVKSRSGRRLAFSQQTPIPEIKKITVKMIIFHIKDETMATNQRVVYKPKPDFYGIFWVIVKPILHINQRGNHGNKNFR